MNLPWTLLPWLPFEQQLPSPAELGRGQQLSSFPDPFLETLVPIVVVHDLPVAQHRGLDHKVHQMVAEAGRPSTLQDGDQEVDHDGASASGTDWTSSYYCFHRDENGSSFRQEVADLTSFEERSLVLPSFHQEEHIPCQDDHHRDQGVSCHKEVHPSLGSLAWTVEVDHQEVDQKRGDHQYRIVAVTVSASQVFLPDAASVPESVLRLI